MTRQRFSAKNEEAKLLLPAKFARVWGSGHRPILPVDRCTIEVFKILATSNSIERIASETGDPIKLSDFRPVACDELSRVGNRDDGGYVVPLQAVEAAGALLSFGLAHDWTFERDFKHRNPRATVHCYDHTVSLRTAFLYSLGQLAAFIVRFKASYLRRAFTWIDYLLFFRADKVHFKQRLWRDHQNDSVTIDDAFGRLPAGCQAFVKMDIEGSEYRVLEDVLKHSGSIVALAIEFHDVDIVTALFNSLVEKIKRDFYIVHIHGNNMGGVAPFDFPIVPEITFLNRRFFNLVPPPSRVKYPVPGLDRPNRPGLPDFAFEF